MADLASRLSALETAVTIAEQRFGPSVSARGRALVDRARKRMSLSLEHTVVALAGGTGSGKSSLFNAIVGTDVATTGVRRPTTSNAQAAVWGSTDASALLDWLAVPQRHRVADGSDGGHGLDGLVLLDLPDYDSTADEHRLEVDRLVEVVDLFVWVVDPQKYADAALHERYLRPLAAHRDVMVVALNQADRLDQASLDACVRDLRGLLAADGLGDVTVLATSATSVGGATALRDALGRAASARRAALERLAADADDAVADLSAACGGGSPRGPSKSDRRAIVDALASAAGIDAVSDAVATSHRMQASRSVGWPLTRWVGRLRPDPLRRLHLDRGPTTARTSLPSPAPATRAQVANALRALASMRSDGLPRVWRESVERAVSDNERELEMDLDRAIAAVDLRPRRQPRWWRVWQLVHLVLVATAVAGGLWLLALFALDYLRLPSPSLPEIGAAPVPTVMLIGGLVAGLLFALAGRPLVAAGARRRRRLARQSLRVAVDDVAQRRVLAPLTEELDSHARFCRALASARR